MLLFRKSAAVLLLLFLAFTSYSQLYITNSSSAQALAQKLVGGGVTISNVTMTGANISTGFFTHFGGTQLNLDSGIVLTSGRAQTSLGFGLNGAAVAFASSSLGTSGDADLQALVSPNTTNDAAILEFDFVPLGDSIEFRYVFSSEEYPEFACTNFNDVFAFFISGPGITGLKNLAIVPGTNIPVAINSINSGTPSVPSNLPICQQMGPGAPFSQFYVNNSTNNFFTHDGHTKVLTAASAVTPCQTYHLKIAIADVGDAAYDSGVFLEAESLRSDPIEIVTSLPLFNGLPYVVEGCQGGSIEILRSKKEISAQQVNLAFAGNAGNGIDVQYIPSQVTIPANDSVIVIPIIALSDNLDESADSLKIYVSSGCIQSGMAYLDSITIHVRDYDSINIVPQDTVVCNNVPMQMMAYGNFTSIQWSPATGLNNPAIANPLATPASSTTYYVTASIGSCIAKDSVMLKVKSLQLLSKSDINCKNGNTGQIRVSGGELWKSPVQYNFNNQPYGSDSTFSNLTAGNYTVRVKDATGCVDSIQVALVQAYPDLLLDDSIVSASCVGTNGQILLSATGGLSPYTFAIDNNPYTATTGYPGSSGNHTINVKDVNGCITSLGIVVPTDPPISFTATPSQQLCNGSTTGFVYVNASGGNGQYEYSIDGTNFQQADSLLVNNPNVTVTVRDNKGCSATNSIVIPINTPVYAFIGNDTTICEGQSVHFNTIYNATGFNWNPHPTLSSTSIPDPVVAPVNTTTYYLTVTKDICLARDTITVAVLKAPVANAGPDSTICFGKTINLSGSGGSSYLWMPSGAVTNPTLANAPVKPLQTSTYFLQVTDINGCKSLKYDTVVITITPPIQAFAGTDTMVAIGQPLQLMGMDLGNSGASVYTWTPSLGLNDPTIPDPVATLTDDITYTLTLATPEGCEGSDQVSIKVYAAPEIYVPSGFTPNGDGKNDVLRAIPVGMKKFNYFKIYNRWGQEVFSTVSEHRGWDGRISGVKQSTGTYVWIAEGIDYKGTKIQRKGVTTLIR